MEIIQKNMRRIIITINGYDWGFGDGEFNFFFNETSSKEWFISFPASRREDAMLLYKAFEKCFMEILKR